MAIGQYGNVVPDAPQTGWEILDQQETVDEGPSGSIVRGMRVYFRTGKQLRGSVFIPINQYTPTNVRAAVAALAAQLDQVQGSTG